MGPVELCLRRDWTPDARGIEDFVGVWTSWDPGLRGIKDSAEDRTLRHIGSESCSVLFSLRTQTFRINSVKWTPLGLMLVDSVI